MTELHPTRRTVVRTAAWAVPAVTVATASPAFAASPPVCLTAAEPIIWQTLTVTVYTRVRTYAKVLTIENKTDGPSKNVYTFQVPQYVRVGAVVPTKPIACTSTLGKADAKKAYDAGGRKITSGWIDTGFNWGGGFTLPTSTQRMTLSPTGISIPSDGNTQLVTNFTGSTPALTASMTPGTYAISFVNPTFEPVQGNAATYNGQQVAQAFIGSGTATVHSMIPPTVIGSVNNTPANTNDWGTQGQAQSLFIANYTVLPAC